MLTSLYTRVRAWAPSRPPLPTPSLRCYPVHHPMPPSLLCQAFKLTQKHNCLCLIVPSVLFKLCHMQHWQDCKWSMNITRFRVSYLKIIITNVGHRGPGAKLRTDLFLSPLSAVWRATLRHILLASKEDGWWPIRNTNELLHFLFALHCNFWCSHYIN